MEVNLTKVTKLHLTKLMGEPYKLDPVTVILENLGPGQGKIIIECFGESWSHFWPAMGDQSLAGFFCSCDEHYIAKKLSTVREDVPDYEGLTKVARERIIERRRDGDIAKQYARELYEDASDLGDSPENLDTDKMSEIFGSDWWEDIPEKENPDYQYLFRIIRAVQDGIKLAGV